jgi:hypothetical protein
MRAKPILEKRTTPLAKRGRTSLKRMPVLETMFEDEGDPFEGIEPTHDPQRDPDTEMSAILSEIRERRKAANDRFRVARDPDYYLVLCFQSHDQRNEFLAKSGWGPPDERYLNGLEIARRLDVGVQPIEIKPLEFRGKPKKYSEKEVL